MSLLASVTSPAEELARLDQALEDLVACEAASVSLVHCPSAARERGLVRELTARARRHGFATAAVSMREHGPESPDELVRAVIDQLVPCEDDRPRGLLWILDLYCEEHGDAAARDFAAATSAADAQGDLTALCRAYIETEDEEAVKEVRAFQAWLDGVEPPRKYRNRAVRRALSERTAQRALNELTRIVRAIGYTGLVVVLTEGDAIASRTERQREKGYTVLRELVDNFDGAAGAVATRVIITGRDALFEGDQSIRSVDPLRMRLEIPSDAHPAPPHRSWTSLNRRDGQPRHRRAREPEASTPALRSLIRISQGLPPTAKVTRMSVGQDKLDRSITKLFDVVSRAGSIFSVLVGEYGSGKTHLMLHTAERALEDNRPVFWLNLERTNLDLGNPARHLTRFLEHSQLPMRGRPNVLALAARWTRSKQSVATLLDTLAALEATGGEAGAAASKALRIAANAKDPGFALENFLSGSDLDKRPGDASYRRDAYRRIFLWIELLAILEDIRGPVILIDEAENLYTSGRPPASRRTSLRSLSFYCGGALPGACVLLAMTPAAYEELKGEARDLLADAEEMATTLELENVARFRRALWGLKPQPVRALTRAEREELCDRVRRMHQSVRGPLDRDDWSEHARQSAKQHTSPRTLIRALIDELESQWWGLR